MSFEFGCGIAPLRSHKSMARNKFSVKVYLDRGCVLRMHGIRERAPQEPRGDLAHCGQSYSPE
jgi:hypothetical protein